MQHQACITIHSSNHFSPMSVKSREVLHPQAATVFGKVKLRLLSSEENVRLLLSLQQIALAKLTQTPSRLGSQCNTSGAASNVSKTRAAPGPELQFFLKTQLTLHGVKFTKKFWESFEKQKQKLQRVTEQKARVLGWKEASQRIIGSLQNLLYRPPRFSSIVPRFGHPLLFHLTLVKDDLSQLTPVFYMAILFNVTPNMQAYFFLTLSQTGPFLKH